MSFLFWFALYLTGSTAALLYILYIYIQQKQWEAEHGPLEDYDPDVEILTPITEIPFPDVDDIIMQQSLAPRANTPSTRYVRARHRYPKWRVRPASKRGRPLKSLR